MGREHSFGSWRYLLSANQTLPEFDAGTATTCLLRNLYSFRLRRSGNITGKSVPGLGFISFSEVVKETSGGQLESWVSKGHRSQSYDNVVVVHGDAHGIHASQKLYYHCAFRVLPHQASHVRHLVSSSAPWTFTFLRSSTTSSGTRRYSSS